MSKTLAFKVFCFEAYRAEKNFLEKKLCNYLKNMEFLIILMRVLMCYIQQEEII